MADIVMPRLSDTMEEGTILRWLKRDGEEVARGEELVEIETDKATMIYESDQAGLLQTVAAEGDTLAVGALIARVAAGDGEATGGAAEAQPVAQGAQTAQGAGTAQAAEVPPGPERAGAAQGAGAPAGGPPAATVDGGPQRTRVKASPLARRIARERGVDLGALSGSGPGGRIVKADVEGRPASAPPAPTAPEPPPVPAPSAAPSAAPAGASAAAPAGASAATAGAPTGAPGLQDVMRAKGETAEQELTRTQQTIARRMAESKATIPDFMLEVEVDMQECVELRNELKRLSPQAPTYNDMVVKASALALREHPRANGSYRDGKLQLHSRVNVGVAVAVEGALIVPTVFDADSKALGEIARETRALAERVRSGAITPPELGGGTFTVTNLGMFGVRSFAAIINPPQAAILSVGSLEPRPVVVGGGLNIRNTMSLTLSCDHRILYGADAAQFLARVRELLERPSALTL